MTSRARAAPQAQDDSLDSSSDALAAFKASQP